MAAALKADLDKNEEARLNVFNALMKDINEKISEISTFTSNLLEKSEVERLQEFVALMKSINEEISRIFTYTHDLLAKGEETRLKDFNEVMKGIRNNVKDLKTAVAELLGDYAQDRGEASAAWKKMSEILAQLRGTATTQPKEVPAKKIMETPVKAPVAQPVAKQVVKPAPALSMEDKLLAIINKAPNGLKVSDMETPLGETRMKIGYMAKKLLDDGKVLKVDNLYFPKPKKI